MRLRKSNSLQASKLARSLRNSALQSKARTPLHAWESPETLTNRGKSSRVSERSIHKLSDKSTFLDERGTYAANKRLTRATNEEGKAHLGMYRPVDELGRTRGDDSRKLQWRGKVKFMDVRKAGTRRRIPEPLDNKERENCDDLQSEENLAFESQLGKPSGASGDRTLTRLDAARVKQSFDTKAESNISSEQKETAPRLLHQNPKKLRQARAVLMSLVQQKILPSSLTSRGVTTRQKTNSTVQDQPIPEMQEQKQSIQISKSKEGFDEVAQKNSAFATTKGMVEGDGAVSETEVSMTLCKQKGLSEEGQARRLIGRPCKIPVGNPEGRPKKQQQEASQISVRRSERKRNVEDLKQTNHAMHRPEDLTSQRVEPSVETTRQSKRNRTTSGLSGPSQHEAITKGLLSDNAFRSKYHPLDNCTAALQVRGQTKNMISEEAEKATKVRQDETGPGLDVLKIDPLGKSCLVATNPMETGGRQMRPRPLDLEQPLIVLVEGQDEDYYNLDGGSFHRMLQQQPEWSVSSSSKLRTNGTGHKMPEVLDAEGEKAGFIMIPSFHRNIGSDNSLEGLYVLPDSYIKASSEDRTRHEIEYDMDEEDEEWLDKYNQSLSPKSTLSADQFEKIVDLLENKANGAVYANSITQAVEDIEEQIVEECCICNGGENSATNPVNQCSCCNILVHQSCYGIQGGSRRQRRKKWNCRKCEAVAEGRDDASARCSLCRKQGGALKPTTEPYGWAHVVCALYTNETYFVNPDAMEPIDGIEAADARARRQKRRCWLCGVREGSVERCSLPACKALFHVSCGVTQGASFVLQHSNNKVTSVRAFCPQHALENARATSKEDMEENLSHPSRRGDQRRSPRKGTFYSSGRNKEHAEASTSKECVTGRCIKKHSEVEEALDRASAETACAALTADDMRKLGPTSPGLMEGIYLYWVSKRAKEGGALLHHIQQEHAAKQFRIFNSDNDADNDDATGHTPSSSPHWSSPMRLNETDMVLEARQQLQRLQDLTLLIVQRESLKLEILSLNQDILRAGIKARNASGRPCSFCLQTRLCLVCTACNRSTCLLCLRSGGSSRPKNWLDSLRLTCLDCESQGNHTQSRIACKPQGMNCSVAPAVNCTSRQHKKVPKDSPFPSDQRPFILLPRSDAIHQDKFAMEAFWEQKPNKTGSVSDLLKKTEEISRHVRRY